MTRLRERRWQAVALAAVVALLSHKAWAWIGGPAQGLRCQKAAGQHGQWASVGRRLSPTQRAAEGVVPHKYELWLDVRSGKWVVPGASVWSGTRVEELPDIRGAVRDIEQSLAKILRSAKVQLPPTIVDGFVVDRPLTEQALEAAKDQKLRVLFAVQELEGATLPDSAFFVFDAATNEPLGAIMQPATPAMATSRAIRGPLDVRKMVPKKVDPEEQARKEERERLYQEGLKNPDKYVMPSPERRAEILGGKKRDTSVLEVDFGDLVAKAVPYDAATWGRMLMMRQKDGIADLKAAQASPS